MSVFDDLISRWCTYYTCVLCLVAQIWHHCLSVSQLLLNHFQQLIYKHFCTIGKLACSFYHVLLCSAWSVQ